ncbi:MAG TPA: TIGR03960 family B12-binding radical SAM protein [Bacillota bacterium]|nr:TIGR03960 family B12-binding radical SAM protein [Bacillota bacterium]
MTKILDDALLATVSKPVRYMGQELNAVVKPPESVEVSIAFAFPDVYDVGMSHLGSKILYHVVNSLEWAAMERVFAPWPDYEALLRKEGAPLTTLENHLPLNQFPFLGVTLQYELTYTNLLTILDLGGIPLLAADRGDNDPIVIAGGPGAFNCEPITDYLDLITLGDGEEILPKLLELYRQLKRKGPVVRKEYLLQAALLQGVYVSSFYEASYNEVGEFIGITSLVPEAVIPVRRNIVQNLDTVPYPETLVVPYGEIIHDRAMIELFRGCTAGCRFCQAGCLYRPVRERSLQTLLKQAELLLRSTGYDEISLISLSSMDYTQIEALIDQLLKRYRKECVGVALPSLRVDSFSVQLADKVQQVRKSGLTLAPEAGSQRLRDVINKRVSEQQILDAAGGAFDAGWSSLKLYFMLGLPSETDEDLAEIIALAQKIAALYRQKKRRGKLHIGISVSTFVPKPHTSFQWMGQIPVEEIKRRQYYLRSLLRDRAIELSTHDAETSVLEAVFSRGDRHLAKVVLRAWQLGARFDGWSEYFRPDLWRQAFIESGIVPESYSEREIDFSAALPWDHLDSGISKDWFINQWHLAEQAIETPDCRSGDCSMCGVCPSYGVENLMAKEVR